MSIDVSVLKWLSLSTLAVAGLLFAHALAGASGLARQVERHVARLDLRLRRLFLPTRGDLIVAGQATLCLLGLSAWLWWADLRLLVLVVAGVWGPQWTLSWLGHRRRARIEAKADAFALSLSNALQATPNIARALATVAASAPAPIDQELDLTLRELRVGSTLEQALSDLTARVSSPSFDATITALLVGRRVGGDVPEILKDTGATLREMMRLSAVLRTKTADGRIQTLVLSLAPAVLAFGLDLSMPGYFDPLMHTGVGTLMLAVAGAAWLCALLLVRRILSVQL